MIIKVIMSADEIKVFDTHNFTRTLVSPKEIGDVTNYKDTAIVRIAEGLPTKTSKTYTQKNWKRITITGERNTYILYTPNETYVLDTNGKIVEYF